MVKFLGIKTCKPTDELGWVVIVCLAIAVIHRKMRPMSWFLSSVHIWLHLLWRGLSMWSAICIGRPTYVCVCVCVCVRDGWYSVVGVATTLGAGLSGIEPGRGDIFRTRPDRPRFPPCPPQNRYRVSFPGWRVHGVVLTTQLLLPRLQMVWCYSSASLLFSHRHVTGWPLPFFFWHNAPQWARASSITRFLDHTQRRNTFDRSPLDEGSALRRDLYLTTHDTHQQTNIHAPDRIRAHNLSRQAAADLRLRPRCYWDRRPLPLLVCVYRIQYFCIQDIC